jgi:hypothetical protein
VSTPSSLSPVSSSSRRLLFHSLYPLPSAYICAGSTSTELAHFLGADEFPFNTRRNNVLAAGPAGLAAVLLAPPGPIELVASAIKFRHALADEIAGTLKRNGPKNASISFEMRVSAQDFSVLCSYGPVLAAADSIKLKPNGGFHKISYVVYPESVYTNTQAKELIVMARTWAWLLTGV